MLTSGLIAFCAFCLSFCLVALAAVLIDIVREKWFQ